jgi:hypothetical protein
MKDSGAAMARQWVRHEFVTKVLPVARRPARVRNAGAIDHTATHKKLWPWPRCWPLSCNIPALDDWARPQRASAACWPRPCMRESDSVSLYSFAAAARNVRGAIAPERPCDPGMCCRTDMMATALHLRSVSHVSVAVALFCLFSLHACSSGMKACMKSCMVHMAAQFCS